MRLTIERACEEAGAKIVDASISLSRPHPVGTTIATGTMEVIAQRYGTDILVRALRILVAAERGPIKAAEIGATVQVLLRVGLKGEKRLTEVIASKPASDWADQSNGRPAGYSRADFLAAEWIKEIKRPRCEAEKPAREPKPAPRPPRTRARW